MTAAARAHRLLSRFTAHNEHWTVEHRRLTEIPAPPLGEGPRGESYAAQLTELGLVEVHRDAVGNVLGRYPLSGPGPRLAISAHLDTVFGPEVDVTCRREGDLLQGPGVSDDAAGLIMLQALADAFLAAAVELPGELWLAATVGEESVGNLRGARHLAAEGLAGRPLDAFITLDTDVPEHVIRHGTFSANHDLTLRGPGGHAWGDFGVVNPNLTMGRILARLDEYNLPRRPRTSVNCGLLTGGLATNAIPESCRAHLNLRSEDGSELRRLVEYAIRASDEEVAAANRRRWHGDELRLDRQTSDRPGGETPADCALVRAATAAAERLERAVHSPCSSTDANAFMPHGIPAICVYRGTGGGAHTLHEWYDTSTRPEALRQLAETVLRYFELAGDG